MDDMVTGQTGLCVPAPATFSVPCLDSRLEFATTEFKHTHTGNEVFPQRVYHVYSKHNMNSQHQSSTRYATQNRSSLSLTCRSPWIARRNYLPLNTLHTVVFLDLPLAEFTLSNIMPRRRLRADPLDTIALPCYVRMCLFFPHQLCSHFTTQSWHDNLSPCFCRAGILLNKGSCSSGSIRLE